MKSDLHSVLTRSGVIPTPEQTLLLQAGIFSGQKAEDAFEAWSKNLTVTPGDNFNLGLPQMFDQLDLGSQRLLSLLYKNLFTLGVRNPIVQTLGSYYKYVWYKNNLLKARLISLVADFKEINVEPLLMKGIAQIEKYYPDYGMRPTMDIDLAIRREDLTLVVPMLLSKGWESRLGDPGRISQSQIHGHTFYLADAELDLHVDFSAYPLDVATAATFWNESLLQPEGYRILHPAHELFCTLLHGYQWNFIPPIRWVADSTMLLRTFDGAAWEKFYRLIESENYSIPYPMLTYLIQNDFCDVPEKVLSLLAAKTMDKTLLLQTRYALTPHTNDDFIGMRRLFLKIHFVNNGNVLKGMKSSVDHYLYAWNLKNWIELVPAVYRKVKEKRRR